MQTKFRMIGFIGCAAVAVAASVGVGVAHRDSGVPTVDAARATRRTLVSQVTSSGEIKPLTYINLDANAAGPISAIFVREGDQVKKGQVVARIDDKQARADVEAQGASIDTAVADTDAAEAGAKSMSTAIDTAHVAVVKAQADLAYAKENMARADTLLQEKLLSRQDYEEKKSTFDTALSALNDANSRLEQAKANRTQAEHQFYSAQRKVAQVKAGFARFADVLNKFLIIAPINGVVTNLPVRVGESVVMGIQNSVGSTIMTIADMSVITAEVQVDEADIANIKIGQAADVTAEALPDEVFKGTVTGIGSTAIVRSTGVAASMSTTSSQEAKNFKVVIAVASPTSELRPGLSCSARITTAVRKNVLSLPLEALTTRVAPGSSQAAVSGDGDAPETAGVFVVENGKAQFRPVKTGITGSMSIEIVSGISDGDQVVVGSSKVIRTLDNNSKVRAEAKEPLKTNEKS